MQSNKTPKEMQERAAANAKHKEIQQRDAKQAMMDYEVAGQQLRDRTVKLRALRLAKEAADREAAAIAKPAKKAAKKKKA